MRPLLSAILALALFVAAPAAFGCAHRSTRSVVVIDGHRPARSFVIVKHRPARHRHCWRHAGHWHCHR